MAFHPLLRSLDDRVFLIHCHSEPGRIRAGLLVTDGMVGMDWIPVSEEPGLQGAAFLIQLPVDVINQPERYKGYEVLVPARTP